VSRPASFAVNGLLLAAVAVTVAPLLWMVSASLMPAGQSNTFPPPWLPSAPTLANYRELFARIGVGRYSSQRGGGRGRHRPVAAVQRQRRLRVRQAVVRRAWTGSSGRFWRRW